MCVVGVWQRNFKPAVCAPGTTSWELVPNSSYQLLVSKNKLVKETVIVISTSLLPSYHIATFYQLVPLNTVRRYAYYILCFILHIRKITKFYNHNSTKINRNMNTTRMHSNKLVYL